MTLNFVDRLLVVVEQGGLAEAVLNVINRMSNNMAKSDVIFSLQANSKRRNSWNIFMFQS
jgi:hypothetical protein